MLTLIDNYDSFTYNLVHFLGELGAQCRVYRNDKVSVDQVLEEAPQAIVLSPGPCTPNEAGIPGLAYSSGGAPGLGQHGSMSRHEMRNILFARGPSFKRGVAIDAPSGAIDVVPTTLKILGIASDEPLDGRPLEEALNSGPGIHSVDWSTEVHTAERDVEGGKYRQQITVSRVGATTYVDSGQASLGPSA